MQVVSQYRSNNARATSSFRQSKRRARACIMGVATAGAFAIQQQPARAADLLWTPASNIWSTTAPNWSGSTSWVNAPNNGAVFNSSSYKSISVTSSISASSLEFQVSGYTISNAAGGSLTLGTGLSTLSSDGNYVSSGGYSGIVDVTGTDATTYNTAEIDAPITSTVGFEKEGNGLLTLTGPLNITGSYPLTGALSYTTGAYFLAAGNASLTANLSVGGTTPPSTSSNAGAPGGILRLYNGVSHASIPSATTVSLGDGLLDIGANSYTISGLTFVNQVNTYNTWKPGPSDPLVGGYGNGVIGTGSLTVNGAINVLYAPSSGGINTIESNLNLSSGTVVRLATSNTYYIFTAPSLVLSGNLTGSGPLTVVPGYTTTGAMVNTPNATGEMGLFGNNTNTGPMTFGIGKVSITGNNSAGSLTLTNSASVQLLGNANFGSVNTITIENNSTLALLNDTAYTRVGNGTGSAAAANNTDRINDSANIVMRDSTFTYNSSGSGATSSETYGNLNVSAGFNTLNINIPGVTSASSNPNHQAGQAILNGNSLTIGAAATLLINSYYQVGNSVTAQHFFNSVTDAATRTDYTNSASIIPRVIAYDTKSGNYNLVTDDPSYGLSSLTPPAYADDSTSSYTVNNFSGDTYIYSSATGNTPTFTNIASSTINSLTLSHANAYNVILGFASGSTLNISSGMILVNQGTPTFQGSTTKGQDATINFGTVGDITGNPGYFLTSYLPMTGTAGLVISGPGFSEYGSLANLSGALTVSNPTGSSSTNAWVNLFEGSVANGSTSTYCLPGPINIRSGVLSIQDNLTLGAGIGGYFIEPQGLGDVNLGEPENDANILNDFNTYSQPTAMLVASGGTLNGVNPTPGSVFTRNINFNNGGGTNAGAVLTPSVAGVFPAVYTTPTGITETFTGNITLYSPGMLTASGSTSAYNTAGATFSGNISGSSILAFSTGSFFLTGNLNTTGPIWIGPTSAVNVTFSGNASGSTSNIFAFGGGRKSTLAYSGPANLPGGSITISNLSTTGASAGMNDFSIRSLVSSTVSNTININSDLTFNAPSGVSATWAGPITGKSTLYIESGTLTASNSSNTFSGPITINGSNAVLSLTNDQLKSSMITAYKGILQARGTVSSPINLSGGTLYPGYGSTSPQSLTLTGALNASSSSSVAIDLTGLSGTTGISDLITFAGPVTVGGTLNVYNSSSFNLAIGDSFRIFNYSGFTPSGAFNAPPVLPVLPSGEAWNTSALYTPSGSIPAGTISVVSSITGPDAWNTSSGTWETAANWTLPGGYPGGSGTTEIFGNVAGVTGTSTVTLTATEISGNLVFNSSTGINYILQGGGVTMFTSSSSIPAINISSGTQTINSTFAYASTGLNLNTGTGSLTLGGTVNGAGLLTLSPSSVLNLNGTGSSSLNDVTLNSGAVVNLNSSASYSAGALTLNSSSTVNVNGTGTLAPGNVTMNTPSTINLAAGVFAPTGSFTAAAGSNLNIGSGSLLYFNNPNSFSMTSGVILVSGTLQVGTTYTGTAPYNVPNQVTSNVTLTGTPLIVTPGGNAMFKGAGLSLYSGASLQNFGNFSAQSLNVFAGSSAYIAPGAGWAGSLYVAQGGTATFAGQTTGSSIHDIFMPSLTLGANPYSGPASGLLTLGPSTSSANRTLLYVGSEDMPFQGTSGFGGIDLGNGDAVFAGYSAYWLPTIFAIVQAGYNNGAWNGNSNSSAFINSTAAANDPTHLHALGMAWNDVGMNTGAPNGVLLNSNFDSWGSSPYNTSSNTINSTSMLIKYTYYGDANLDGQVNSADYTLIDSGYLSNRTGWYNGDFNYDGKINGSDYTLIDNAFNMQGAQIQSEVASPTAQIGGAASAVPEPASLGLLGIGAVGLLGRRKRHR